MCCRLGEKSGLRSDPEKEIPGFKNLAIKIIVTSSLFLVRFGPISSASVSLYVGVTLAVKIEAYYKILTICFKHSYIFIPSWFKKTWDVKRLTFFGRPVVNRTAVLSNTDGGRTFLALYSNRNQIWSPPKRIKIGLESDEITLSGHFCFIEFSARL